MTKEQRQILGKIIVATAKYYSKQLDRDVVSMMLDDLSNQDFDLVSKAYSVYRSNPLNKFFPLPAQIIEIINPNLTTEDESVLLAEKILKLVSSKGYTWQMGRLVDGKTYFEGEDGLYETFDEALASYIGPENTAVVNRRGTWTKLCEEVNENISGVFKKQLVDSCKVNLKNKKNKDYLLLEDRVEVKLIE